MPCPSAAGRSKATANSLLTVSVVMIALLAAVPASRVSESVPAMAVTPAEILSSGIFGPITPVEPSSTAEAGIPRTFAVCSAVALHRSRPAFPVAALAMPAFTTTACTGQPDSTISRSQITGAAFTLLEVKVPATAQGVSLKSMAISVRP